MKQHGIDKSLVISCKFSSKVSFHFQILLIARLSSYQAYHVYQGVFKPTSYHWHVFLPVFWWANTFDESSIKSYICHSVVEIWNSIISFMLLLQIDFIVNYLPHEFVIDKFVFLIVFWPWLKGLYWHKSNGIRFIANNWN